MALKEIRVKRGFTQTEAAKKLRISQGSLSAYELGKRQPDRDTLIKLADFYKVSTDTILGRQSYETDFSRFTHTHYALLSKMSDLSEMQCEKILSYIDGMSQK